MKTINQTLVLLVSLFFFLSCSKSNDEQTPVNNYPLEGFYYIRGFGTNIYMVNSSGYMAQGGKTFQVELKRAIEPNTYYIVSKADESEVFEHIYDDFATLLSTIISPEDNSQVFLINKVSNVDAYTIVPKNQLTLKLAIDLPPTITFGVFTIPVDDPNSSNIESRFVLEP